MTTSQLTEVRWGPPPTSLLSHGDLALLSPLSGGLARATSAASGC